MPRRNDPGPLGAVFIALGVLLLALAVIGSAMHHG